MATGSMINSYEYRVYSANGEDGILLYIFWRVGTTNCRFVEFGIGSGRECNTANLSLNFGWRGLLMDCDEQSVTAARAYYRRMLGKKSSRIKIVDSVVTAENLDGILLKNGVDGEIDLLSIDIDGNDYWIWKAGTSIAPRVVVIEYNASLGCEKSLTVKYDPTSLSFNNHYAGASLAALTKLAKSKGYILVGCESMGVNAFFVRQDVAQAKLLEVSVKDAYCASQHQRTSEQHESIRASDYDEV